MSYTPPAYNAVNFSLTGRSYAPPAYNAVNFSWESGSYGRVQSGASLSATGVAVCTVAGFVQGSTTLSAEANYFFQSVGSAVAQTTLTPIQYNPWALIETGTTFSVFGGGILASSATIQAGSFSAAEPYLGIKLQGSSTLAIFGGGVSSSAAAAIGRSDASAQATYQRPMRGIVKGAGVARGVGRTQSASVGVVTGVSSLTASLPVVRYSAAVASTSSVVAGKGACIKPGESSIFSQALLAAFWQPMRGGAATISAQGSAAFSGDYTTVSVPQYNHTEGAIFVKTARRQEIFCVL